MIRRSLLGVLTALGLLMAGSPSARAAVSDAPQPVIIVQPVGLTEVVVSSCAGGAVIGYLLVTVSGGGSPSGTALLFCGISAAATMTSAVVGSMWRGLTQ